jgi:hypothetical protein
MVNIVLHVRGGCLQYLICPVISEMKMLKVWAMIEPLLTFLEVNQPLKQFIQYTNQAVYNTLGLFKDNFKFEVNYISLSRKLFSDHCEPHLWSLSWEPIPTNFLLTILFLCFSYSENKLLFNEMLMMSTLNQTNMPSWMFIVLVHWNNCLQLDLSRSNIPLSYSILRK